MASHSGKRATIGDEEEGEVDAEGEVDVVEVEGVEVAVSAYESARRATMAANVQFLEGLGLGQAAAAARAPARKEARAVGYVGEPLGLRARLEVGSLPFRVGGRVVDVGRVAAGVEEARVLSVSEWPEMESSRLTR